MAKQQYDNTVHYDEFHPDVHVAARFADRAANEAAERHLREDHKRITTRLDNGGLDGGERRALYLDRERVDREIRRNAEERKGIEERCKEASGG